MGFHDNCFLYKEAVEIGAANDCKENETQKIRRGGDHVQTTKVHYNVDPDDPYRTKHPDQAFMKTWSEKVTKYSEAADREFLKYTVDGPPEYLTTIPSMEGGYYYIPEQNLMWSWRIVYPHVPKSPEHEALFHTLRPPKSHACAHMGSGRNRQEPVSHSKYSFQNKYYKILIK
ncbi:hypothetical protein TNIN_170681 [Trichonephila inaurata madagascariensis]|uniref:Uncharacterized protein n=1 Tax=Trichonephila inaurata madagascariensis TaxID=2747483 RepID=A0A8X6XUR1_9ARAC|nr:hypothetical protein TNIN_170681 [Trichonephila inaurata madagascariensis]